MQVRNTSFDVEKLVREPHSVNCKILELKSLAIEANDGDLFDRACDVQDLWNDLENHDSSPLYDNFVQQFRTLDIEAQICKTRLGLFRSRKRLEAEKKKPEKDQDSELIAWLEGHILRLDGYKKAMLNIIFK